MRYPTLNKKTNFRKMVVGSSNCGKTFLVLSQIIKNNEWCKLYLVTNTNNSQYRFLYHAINNGLSNSQILNVLELCQNMVNEKIIKTEQMLESVPHMIRGNCKKKRTMEFINIDDLKKPEHLDNTQDNKIIIFDDILDSKMDTIEPYLTRSRHYNYDVYLITQSYMKIKPIYRENFTTYVLFKHSKKKLKAILSTIAYDEDMKLDDLVNHVFEQTKKQYSYYII